ncbi:MAG: phosphate butyryltransferase [Prevotella sp.]|nr:phosphate butyryltransferase [Prevotella sp.]
MKSRRTEIVGFDSLMSRVASRKTRSRMAVVWPADDHTQEALCEALRLNLVDAVLVGCREELQRNGELMAFGSHVQLMEAGNADEAAVKAVELVRKGEAQILMKGLINTDNLLRVVLNKETGILPKGNLMTHTTAALLPSLSRLVFFTDPAVMPYPTPEQRLKQVGYMVELCHKVGISEPRIALVHCTEKVNERHFPFTASYVDIVGKSKEGLWGPCIIDGPLDVKTAIDAEALRVKGINSPLEGRADVLIFPDIVSANVFYKAISLFGGVETAAMLVGTEAPVVLTSRGDSMQTKLYSIALASLTSVPDVAEDE